VAEILSSGVDGALDDFLKQVRKASEEIIAWIRKDLVITIVSHLDADGLASAGILGAVLERLNVPFKIRIVKQLSEDPLRELSSENSNPIIFADLGSGQKDLIKDLIPSASKIILDHHQPLDVELENCVEVNPHNYGIDGSREISAAGVCYFVAKSLDERNVDLSPVAIVGALGDRQDCGKRRNLIGLNQIIVKDALNAKLIEARFGLRLFGFESRPVAKSLEHTLDPLIPGLSGNFEACMKFLERIGVRPVNDEGNLRRLSDLSLSERKTLLVNLVKYMLSKGVESKEAESIMGTVYILLSEPATSPLRDAREFAFTLNACGRLGYPSIGIALCMGRRGRVLNLAEKIMGDYRRTMLKYISWLSRNADKIRVTKHLQIVYGGTNIDDRLAGTLMSMALSSRILSPRKVAVVLATTPEGKVKVSARADRSLVDKGLNLGLAIRRAAKGVGGSGGGHDIAAGAQIPPGTEEIFIKLLDEELSKQMSGGDEHIA